MKNINCRCFEEGYTGHFPERPFLHYCAGEASEEEMATENVPSLAHQKGDHQTAEGKTMLCEKTI